jgi:hypothetical protein
VFVVGKNYRLQDIQLSKIIRGKNPSELAGALGIAPPDPLGSLARGAQRPAPLVRRKCLFASTFTGFTGEGWLANRSSLTVSSGGAKVGEYRARTGDLLVANQALSQLS